MRKQGHMVQWSDKKIKGRHGTHGVSSMWRGVGVCR